MTRRNLIFVLSLWMDRGQASSHDKATKTNLIVYTIVQLIMVWLLPKLHPEALPGLS